MEVSRKEFEAMKDQVNQLQQLMVKQDKHIEELHLVVMGSERLGIEGLRLRQKKDDLALDEISDKLESIERHIDKKIDDVSSELKKQVDEKIRPISEKLNELNDWRETWNKAINIVIGSKTWKILFIIVIGLLSLGAAFKFKLMDLLNYFK